MKNLFKSIASVAIVAMAFAGCSKEAADVTAPITKKGVTVRFNAEVIDETRATLTPNPDEKVFTAAWEDKDQIGIHAYVLDSLANDYTDENIIGEWKNGAFEATFVNCPKLGESWEYGAYYPHVASCDVSQNVTIPFGAMRTQSDNAYNSQYDIMVSDKVSVVDKADAGKDKDGNALVFPMHRLSAIAYFHFMTDKAELQNEKVVSVTLTVDDGKVIAADSVKFCYTANTPKIETVGNSTNSIVLTYDEASRPTANDFTAWFNLLPVNDVTSVTVEIETENYVATIERKSGVSALNYEAGKLYKVAGKISDDKWESISGDYSGTYLIFGKPATGNYWYLSPDSTTDYQKATDTQNKEISDYAIYEEDDNAWVISRKTDGKYIIKSYIKDTYIGNAAKGKASLVDESKAVELIISESKTEGFVNIETETGFYFALNSSAKRFAFYQSSSNQTHDIKLIPYSFNRIETPVVKATADDNGTVSVTWNSIANAANYSVTFNGETQTIEETSKTFTVDKAGNYTISVVANPSDTETYRASKAGVATATIIGNPASAKINNISANALTASWDAVDGATSYHWVVKNGDNEVKSDDVAGTTLSLTDITLAADTEYVLYVKSIATAPQGSLATFTQSEPKKYLAGGAQIATFDLTKIDGFDKWASSYSKQTITNDEANIIFAAASRQTLNIKDCPVTKGSDIEVVLNNSKAQITAITITLKKWASKAQTATLNYSTDGGKNYTTTNPSTTSSTFVLSSSNLPEGTNAVKVTFNSSNQVGCQKIEMTYVE